MIQAVMKVVEYMDEKGLSTEERLRLLGSVSRLNADAVAVKALFDEEGLTQEEQGQAVRAIRTMIRPRKAAAKETPKGKAKK